MLTARLIRSFRLRAPTRMQDPGEIGRYQSRTKGFLGRHAVICETLPSDPILRMDLGRREPRNRRGRRLDLDYATVLLVRPLY